MSDLSPKALSDPWGLAYEVINKGLIDDAVKVLKELLGQPLSSRHFVAGMEFLKALKSLGKPELTALIFEHTLTEDLVRKISNELSPNIIIEGFRKNYGLGMSYLTLLEVLLPRLESGESLDFIKRTINNALRELRKDELREFMRALIYGPLTTLKPPAIKEVTEVALKAEGRADLLLLKAEYLTSLARVHPPVYFIQGEEEITSELGLLLKEVVKEALRLLEEDSITTERIYQEISIFLSEMNAVCKELNDWEPCNKINEVAGKDLLTFYRVMGKRALNELDQGISRW